MTFNLEVKGGLARLLATENLIVEHRPVETACFDIKNRVLTLPMWERATEDVYDMLVGHEVGHALYTPDEYGEDHGVPQSYLNVVEDARIEKMMKRKFPGLARNFYAAYRQLADKDFFEIGDRSMDSYTLIDRINLHFKVGVHAATLIPFNEAEKTLVDVVAAADTFQQVVDAAKRILEYTKEQEQDKIEVPQNAPTQGGGDSTQSGGDASLDQSGGQSQGQSQEQGEQGEPSDVDPDNSGGGTSGGDHNYESETDKAFSESQKQLASKYGNQINYIELPNLKVDSLVIPNKQVMIDCAEHYDQQSHLAFAEVDKEYQKFRTEAQREVNYLVKEFEMRKSADQYARSSVAKTGVLDTQKLHTYKWNEDVFKKINVVPDGKNHGLIFVLDWSGSMGGCLTDTAKQLLNLAWFCRKVQIPFDIYAFTNEYRWQRLFNYQSMTRVSSAEHHKKIPGQVYIHNTFCMMNLVSSSGKNSGDLEKQLKNFWRLVRGESGYSGYSNPVGYGLSGTPLNESVISLTAIIPDFKKRTKAQKVSVIMLSDGEGQSINYCVEFKRNGIAKQGLNYVDSDCMLRDRQTGRVYPRFSSSYNSSDKVTGVFLQAVRDRFPDVNLVGIRLIRGRELNSTYNNSEIKTPYSEIQKQWKKSKSAELVGANGYQSLYVIGIEGLSATGEFEVDDDASIKDIGVAFAQSLAKKSVNKKMLTSFASLIS